jgi:lipid A 4'-phosphatase
MKPLAVYLGVFALSLVLFLWLPQIDLSASGLFYAPGRGFFLKSWPPIEFLYHSISWLAWAMVLVIGIGAVWLLLAGRPLWRLDRKALWFLAMSTALGPGLVVNTVLKDHWGRARPVQIAQFGGGSEFTPAPLPARQCARNCAFPSGHAALGFSLVAFAFLIRPGAARRVAAAAALGVGALVGLARIAQGAHFLSDVVYAGLVVYGTTAALHWWIVDRGAPAAARFAPLFDRTVAGVATALRRAARHLRASPGTRLGSATAAVAVVVAISIATLDRPLAVFCRGQDPGFHLLFDRIGRLGLGYGWLWIFSVAFVALHWGGELPGQRRFDRRLRAWSPIPAFLFAAVAAAGTAADILKVIFGRARPKLLFDAQFYGFTWFGWQADYWSFPSGHAATIVSLLTALAYLWPRQSLFYLLVGAIVAVSRVVVGAHFLSDTIAGAWLAVLTTRGVVLVFARGGIDLAAARHGQTAPRRNLPWPCRRFGGPAARDHRSPE